MAPSGTFWVTTDASALANRDRPEHLGTGPQNDIILDCGMPLATDAIGRVGAAQRHALIDRHIVADIGRFADDGKAVVDEQMPTDLRAGMDIDGSQKSRQMVDQPGEEEQFAPEQPVRQAMQAKRQNARIEKHFPARARSGIARLDRIQISAEIPKHIFPPEVAERPN